MFILLNMSVLGDWSIIGWGAFCFIQDIYHIVIGWGIWHMIREVIIFILGRALDLVYMSLNLTSALDNYVLLCEFISVLNHNMFTYERAHVHTCVYMFVQICLFMR